MKNFFKKMLGLDKLEQEAQTLLANAALAEAAAKENAEKIRLAARTPKELATEKKEPWVAVLDTHVNKDNIRNGFFELDWNEYFVLQLKEAGYKGETEEAVVDKWFQDLCRGVGSESGVEMDRRGSGFINVNNLGGGRTEVS